MAPRLASAHPVAPEIQRRVCRESLPTRMSNCPSEFTSRSYNARDWTWDDSEPHSAGQLVSIRLQRAHVYRLYHKARFELFRFSVIATSGPGLISNGFRHETGLGGILPDCSNAGWEESIGRPGSYRFRIVHAYMRRRCPLLCDGQRPQRRQYISAKDRRQNLWPLTIRFSGSPRARAGAAGCQNRCRETFVTTGGVPLSASPLYLFPCRADQLYNWGKIADAPGSWKILPRIAL